MRQTLEQWLDYIGGLHPIKWDLTLDRVAEVARRLGVVQPARRVILVAGDPAQAYLAFDPETLRIGGLYSNITGSGVGKALMDCIKVGRDYLWLNTHVPNEAAQKFYKREGFVEISNEGAEPSNIMPEIRMAWCR